MPRKVIYIKSKLSDVLLYLYLIIYYFWSNIVYCCINSTCFDSENENRQDKLWLTLASSDKLHIYTLTLAFEHVNLTYRIILKIDLALSA